MAKSMVHGSIPKHLIMFTIPTILGNLFQLTYNAVDSIILGRFVGTNALAAVGTANPIMNIVTFLIVGICMGASVLMSEFYGGGKMARFKNQVSTTIVIGAMFTVFISVVGFFLSRHMLMLIMTPVEIIDGASGYLKIIFTGLIFTFFYNVYSASLRSVGDSVTPIIFLIMSVIINGVLDVWFVVFLKWGIVGTAVATIIAQAFSCISCIIYVYIKVPILKLKAKEFIIDKSLLRKTISYSWAAAMQQTCLYLGKLLVQGAVNPLGVDTIATFNAVNRVDDFAFTPQQSIGQSLTVLIAQNRGAKKHDRIKKGVSSANIIMTIYSIFIGTVVYVFSKNIMHLFIHDGSDKVVQLGVRYLVIISIFYIMSGIINVLQGYFRGMGQMKITLCATFSQIVVRVIFSFLLAPKFGVEGIAYACILGWVGMISFEAIMYRRSMKNDF